MTHIFNQLPGRRFFVTFGWGQPNQNKYYILYARDWTQANEKAHVIFGRVYANIYDEKCWVNPQGITQAEEYNLTQLMPPSETVSGSPSASCSVSSSPSYAP